MRLLTKQQNKIDYEECARYQKNNRIIENSRSVLDSNETIERQRLRRLQSSLTKSSHRREFQECERY